MELDESYCSALEFLTVALESNLVGHPFCVLMENNLDGRAVAMPWRCLEPIGLEAACVRGLFLILLCP